MEQESWLNRWPGGLLALAVAAAASVLLMVLSVLGMFAYMELSLALPFSSLADTTSLPVVGEVYLVSLFGAVSTVIGAALYGWLYGRLLKRWWFFAPLAALVWLVWGLLDGVYADEPELRLMHIVALLLAAVLSGITSCLAADSGTVQHGV
ncbi:MAG: hypothetical protein R6V19_07670 [Armatimonadota bacterium]